MQTRGPPLALWPARPWWGGEHPALAFGLCAAGRPHAGPAGDGISGGLAPPSPIPCPSLGCCSFIGLLGAPHFRNQVAPRFTAQSPSGCGPSGQQAQWGRLRPTAGPPRFSPAACRSQSSDEAGLRAGMTMLLGVASLNLPYALNPWPSLMTLS